jgi:hypothetical protein
VAAATAVAAGSTLQALCAAERDWCTPDQRAALRAELAKLRPTEESMRRRWEGDEMGWRKLPARAWPARQPNPDDIPGIHARLAAGECPDLAAGGGGGGDGGGGESAGQLPEECRELAFDLATALAFNRIDGPAALSTYRALDERHGDLDSVVALGVCLVEGVCVDVDEPGGVRLLERAAARGSAQACYELGTLQYNGMTDCVPEDEAAAFANFERAAAEGHAGALFMAADCLIEGTGVAVQPARAVPMLLEAAEQGHRYARQRVRELLDADALRDR